MYVSREPPEEPPCEDCRVILLTGNEDAAKIFNINRHQLIIAGMDGIIVDINHVPIYSSIRLHKIKDEQECFEKVLLLNGWWVKKLNEKKGD